MTEKQKLAYEKIAQELRRGLVILAALSRLKKKQYGYSLINELAEEGLEIEQGTLYPLLRRLDPERAHDLTIWALRNGFGPQWNGESDPRLRQQVWGLEHWSRPP